MKLLVTGGAGFIGSSVVRNAVARGLDVVNLDALTYASNLENVSAVADSARYTFERVDIRDLAVLEDAFARHSPDAVMHLAAESHVDRSIDGPKAFVDTNVMGTFNLLQAARKHYESLPGARQDAFRVHHVSTDEVYGDLAPDDPDFTEDTPYAPSSPYAASKAASDHLVRAWGRTFGLPVVLSNCSNNYGPYQFPEKLIPVVILKALHRQPIPVYGTGEQVRDWLYVDDHADALLTVLQRGALGRTYNIGSDNARTNIEVVRTLCDLMDRETGAGGHRDLIALVADRPGHDARYAIDAHRIRSELGWSPSVTWDEGLARTLRWYLDNEGWWRPLLGSERFGERLGTIGS